jgi:hypothetical protein
MGELDSGNLHSPTGADSDVSELLPKTAVRGTHTVAVQVAFERQTLKPFFHFIGSRVETTWVRGAFQLRDSVWVRGSQRAPPPPHCSAAGCI